MINDPSKVQAIDESVKCYYCLGNIASIHHNDTNYSLFLEQTKEIPYNICYNCWSMLRSLKVTDGLFFRFKDIKQISSKPKTAFKFTMIGLCQEFPELLEKALIKEESNLQLQGFRNDTYIKMPINLLVIESLEQLLFIFEIPKTDLTHQLIIYYKQFTEINLLVLDGKNLEQSRQFLEEYNQKSLQDKHRNTHALTILLGVNFNKYTTNQRQTMIDLQGKLDVHHWFLLDSQGTKKDSSNLSIRTISEFLFFACNSYLELNN